MSRDIYHQENDARNIDIINKLSDGAPSADIKKIIQCYSVNKSGEIIFKNITKFRMPQISETAEYIKIATIGIRKHQLITKIINQIETLLMEKCDVCNEYYCLDIDEIKLFQCDRCQQGCHTPCFKDLSEVIDKKKFHMMKFFCNTCLEEETEDEVTTPSKQNQNNKDGNNILSSREELLKLNTQPDETQTTQTDESHKVENTDNRDQITDNRKMCSFFLRGNCRYGISGKTGGTCKFKHVPMCRKYRNNGSTGPTGCQDKNCRFWHPPLCWKSEKTRTCYDEQCRFWHIRGTKRSEDYGRHTQTETQRISETNINTNTIPHQRNATSTITESNVFLEKITQEMNKIQHQQQLFQQQIMEQVNQRFYQMMNLQRVNTQQNQQAMHIPSAPVMEHTQQLYQVPK